MTGQVPTHFSPSRMTLMIKPVGAVCNLACRYCYYLPTQALYGGHEKRMSLETLESIFAGYLPGAADHVTIAYQGGEPTLAGLEFFKKAIEFQCRHKRPGQTIAQAIQTNGTLLTPQWCEFLREHNFLVGISIDGNAHLHDHYRVDHRDAGTHDAVLRGLKLLRKHRVEHNVLTVLNNRNIDAPAHLFNYLLQLGVDWMQFIPAIEWAPGPESRHTPSPGASPTDHEPACNCHTEPPSQAAAEHREAGGHPGGKSQAPQPDHHPTDHHPTPAHTPRLQPFSPTGEQYGRFLCEVFDLWFDRQRDRVSVREFDNVLMRLVRNEAAECIHAEACHSQVTVEHNGDVYGCDHFVEPDWRLGHIGDGGVAPRLQAIADAVGTHSFTPITLGKSETDPTAPATAAKPDTGRLADTSNEPDASSAPDTHWFDRLDNQRLGTFAARKLGNLNARCRQCPWLTLCHGGCPKHRPYCGATDDLNVLCPGYERFYAHTIDRFQWLAGYLRQGITPPPPRGSSASHGQNTPRRPDTTTTKPRYKSRRRK